MLEIYLIRHGLTLWNVEKRFQGCTDIPLSAEGIHQAELACERLRHLKFDAIYASDLQRALQTAKIIAKPHGKEAISLVDLREIHMGVWEGLTWDEIRSVYPKIHQTWTEYPTRAIIPNSEGVTSAGLRGFTAFKTLAECHKNDERILIVSHGLINATILCQINGLDLDDWYQMRQDNTAVNIIEYDGQNFCPRLINCTSHCSGSNHGIK